MVGRPEGGFFRKRFSIGEALIVGVSLVLATVMVTYTVCADVWRKKVYDERSAYLTSDAYASSDLELLAALFHEYSYAFSGEDEKEIMPAVLKAYVAATGDRFAAYYTPEEYAATEAETAGSSVGIGIVVYAVTEKIAEKDELLLHVAYVTPGSPAETAGMRVGDEIDTVFLGEEKTSVTSLGYAGAMNAMRGDVGTTARFTVLRDGESFEMNVPREPVPSTDLIASVCKTAPNVGVIRILSFDYPLPENFDRAMNELTAKGCDRFVLDLWGNPGGALTSVKALLSRFLPEDSVLLTAKDKNGKETVYRVSAETFTGDAAPCSVAGNDIGKYAGLPFAVLCDGDTASAAELFCADVRDYSLGLLYGEKTYGKGCMQTTYPLPYLKCGGAVKLTTHLYFPACGEGYDGKGITPDVSVSLSEEGKKINPYERPETLDAVLLAAVGGLTR